MGKGNTTTDQEKKTSSKMCILVTSTDMSLSCELVAAVKCFCLTGVMPQKVYWSSNIYIQDYISGIIGELSPFLRLPSLMIDVIGYPVYLEQVRHRLLSLCVTGLILFFVECTAEVTPCAWPHIIIAVDTCCSYVMCLVTVHWSDAAIVNHLIPFEFYIC